ncbi:MAG: 3'(2'),5'-bisphosphate nucleotidase CysQ [Gammaproteobacteria bacterium]|nr:3'(2'),5'-bisphosphate nucleotidase CysQ [Gammaproteobacteria bacterium]
MAAYEHYLQPILDLAIAAGEKIVEIYDQGCCVEQKSDNTPVTIADYAAHDLIVAGLSIIAPEIPCLSEESEGITTAERQSWGRYWLVDPLDGTRDFINRTGEFSVNIALMERDCPVLGVIYAPITGMFYYAARGFGAWKGERGSSPHPIHVRRCDPQRVVVTCGRSTHSPLLQQFCERLPGYEIIRLGSALKSCLVAEGGADIYARFGPTSEWDTAAAQCVVEEAGGRVSDLALHPLRYNSRDHLLNPHFFVTGESDLYWPGFVPSA